MIAFQIDQPEIGSTIQVDGKPAKVVGVEEVARGDALRRPQGRCVLVRLGNGSDVWLAVKKALEMGGVK